ncbi:uncharacterized protein Z519_10062 [Cladophialophora bantiana CBS 173.52]|uniref:BZIP domain-containing protein n=1 Tax=Cladophialophora bantiana (strain ATCC 10958 / CBS 173.52 / CDC B-1940 / NIH 8579) TaxID=1442370 RepID=A0A0D2HEG1_CLAB1|nr:uncharacterized protein Z519_10062 [Cladophialophora bantiana CBS 173.52]KIW89210.1 hypothetical protein Z519_10062 [Cladophialophora bantiana CBS 173.52]
MSAKNSTASIASKYKQERIRDNQRRSRARRQEYLADLERRVHESYIACREADLQRIAFADLKAENARLRDLLKSVGIDPGRKQIDDRKDAPRNATDVAPASFRQIMPKLSAPKIPGPLPTRQQECRSGTCCSTCSYSPRCPPQPAASTENIGALYDQCPDQLMTLPTTPAATPAMTISSVTNVSPSTALDDETAKECQDSTSICDTIHVPSNEALPEDEYSVQCSVIKGIEHLDTRTSTNNNTVSTNLDQNGSQEAEQLYIQVMETSLRVLGAEHVSTLTIMAHLASIYRSQGRWKEAEELDARLLEARMRVLGAEDL